MTYSDAEREEAAYELWVISGGRASRQQAELEAAHASIVDLENKGYLVLSKELRCDASDEFPVLEVVIRKGDELSILRWKPFNKGWMKKGIGWSIFTA